MMGVFPSEGKSYFDDPLVCIMLLYAQGFRAVQEAISRSRPVIMPEHY